MATSGTYDREHVARLDLAVEPPDADLITGAELTSQEWSRWLPWRRIDQVLWVATCVPVSPELAGELADRFDGATIGFRRVTPSGLQACVQRELRERHLFEISEGFAVRRPDHSAKLGLVRWQRLMPAVIGLLVLAGLLIDWRLTLFCLLTLANVAFVGNASFRIVAAAFRPVTADRSRRIARAEHAQLTRGGAGARRELERDSDLPVYTVLIPVFDEANVIAQIIENLTHLRYPRNKLDVLVLLEESDTATIAAAWDADPPPHVRMLVVPDGQPRTKPRACNYGLQFARGEYVVIFDAEDRPDPDQLLRALAAFRYDARTNRGREPLACVQAALNYYNADYNVLTRMFAIEYAHWFDSMLPGLDAAGFPIPLGGTSNHFKVDALLAAGGWDPYNVTEDADLGLRLAASGYRVDVVDSTTWEEATARTWPWITQRTRWIKGYMITAAVNLRRPVQWIRRCGARGLATLLGLVLGTPVTFLLYPLMLGFTLGAWVAGPVVPVILPAWLLIFGTVNLVAINLLMILTSAAAAWRRYNWRIALFAVFLPFYWLLHSFAAWRAAWQVIRDPHRWEKTPHGLTEEYDDGIIDTGGLPHAATS